MFCRELFELTGEIFHRLKKFCLSYYNKKANNVLGKE